MYFINVCMIVVCVFRSTYAMSCMHLFRVYGLGVVIVIELATVSRVRAPPTGDPCLRLCSIYMYTLCVDAHRWTLDAALSAAAASNRFY